MEVIYPNQGLVAQLQKILDFGGDGLFWNLFTNDITPNKLSHRDDFDTPTFSGYAGQNLHASDFTVTGLNGSVGFAIANAITWTNGGSTAVAIYGFFVTDTDGNNVYQAARFDDAPITLLASQQISVLPTWGDYSQEPSP